MAEREAKPEPRVVGRYELHAEVASGGMATVHVGRMLSDAGFSRTVAIKQLHAHLARDPTFSAMFIDEARLASRIQHPNVVATLDVVSTAGELFVVMDYVKGEALSQLIRGTVARRSFIPADIVSSIAVGMLDGLHAAHEAKDEREQPLGIVHRDVSPQNVLVGIDGITRVIDFGVAKAVGRLQTTRDGQLKGKLGYMPPEQFEGKPADRRGDVYSAAVVLWEALTGQRLFEGQTEAETFWRVLSGPPEPPSTYGAAEASVLDDIIMRGLARDPGDRFATAREMALAFERTLPPAPTRKVGEWVSALAADALTERERWVAEVDSLSSSRVYVAPVAGVVTAVRETSPRLQHTSAEDSLDDTVKEPLSPLDVPTPLQPIVSSPPSLPASQPSPTPTSQPPTSTEAAWTEKREGGAWRVEFRPVSLTLVVLVAVFALTSAGWVLSQRQIFGVLGTIAMVGGLLVALAFVLRMLHATRFRLDAEGLKIAHWPSGRSSTIPTRQIREFILIEEGEGKDPLDFSLHYSPFTGEPQRLDVTFSTEAEARHAVRRMNEMLADVRGE